MLNQAPPPVPAASPPPVERKPPLPRRTPPPAAPTPLPVVDADEDEPRVNGETVLAMFSSFGISLLAHLFVFSMLAFLILRVPREDLVLIDSAIDSKKPISNLQTLSADMSPLPVQKVKEQSSKRTIVPITKTGPVGGIQVDIEAPDVGTPNPGKGAGGRGKLFGTGREAKSMVFVVDCSSSMTGRRFELAINELIRVIRKLKSSQRFFVVFYSSETIPLFATPDISNIALPNGRERNVLRRAAPRRRNRRVNHRLVPGSSSYKKRAEAWIKRLRASGGTQPAEALQIALRMKPEVIYFLTDGAIPFNTPQIIRESNRHRVRVNTVALGFAGSEQLLKQIARENNKGTYTYVEE